MAPPHTPDELATLLQEVQEKEVRLTALINCVGLRSLDELEDFVYLHGSGKLVPVEQADAADEETQLVASPGKKAMRYHQRKEELKMSRDEVKRTVVELNYSKETHREDLRKLEDVERRLGVMSRDKQELERRLDELSVEGGLQEQLGSCYSIIDGLDDQLRRIGEYVDQVELERDSYIEAAKESEAARVILQEQMDELLHRAMSVPQPPRLQSIAETTPLSNKSPIRSPHRPSPVALHSPSPQHPVESTPISSVKVVETAPTPIASTSSVFVSSIPAPPTLTTSTLPVTTTLAVHSYPGSLRTYEKNQKRLVLNQDWIQNKGLTFVAREAKAFARYPLPPLPPFIDIATLPSFPPEGDEMMLARLEEANLEVAILATIFKAWKNAVFELCRISATFKSKDAGEVSGTPAGRATKKRRVVGSNLASSSTATPSALVKMSTPASPRKSKQAVKTSSPSTLRSPTRVVLSASSPSKVFADAPERDSTPPPASSEGIPKTPTSDKVKPFEFDLVAGVFPPSRKSARKSRSPSKSASRRTSVVRTPVAEQASVVESYADPDTQSGPEDEGMEGDTTITSVQFPQSAQRRRSVTLGSPSKSLHDSFPPPPSRQPGSSSAHRRASPQKPRHEPFDVRPPLSPFKRTTRPRSPSPSPSRLKEEAQDVALPSPTVGREAVRFFARMGSPPMPAPDWEAIGMEEQRVKDRREGKSSSRRDRATQRQEEVVVPVSKSKKRRRREEEEDEEEEEEEEESRSARKARRTRERADGEYEREIEAAIEEEDRQEQKRLKGKGKVKEERQPVSPAPPSSAELAKGPSADDPHGIDWFRKLHLKRAADNQRKKDATPKTQANSMPKFEINPERNQGRSDHYAEVVRKKEDRKKMHAAACPCCVGYYERAAGPASKDDGNKSGNQFLEARHQQIQARLMGSSRHRAQHRADPDPPDYWQFGFPSTQKVADINARAAVQREEKRQYQESEAMKDGFYRYRKP